MVEVLCLDDIDENRPVSLYRQAEISDSHLDFTLMNLESYHYPAYTCRDTPSGHFRKYAKYLSRRVPTSNERKHLFLHGINATLHVDFAKSSRSHNDSRAGHTTRADQSQQGNLQCKYTADHCDEIGPLRAELAIVDQDAYP
ncbi:hypothetical protein T265_10460 [Opisthorchis viverrini]|uniref:Uncharacterized protein n=1 Tax=Opisthorchis viverrini TaxID=6198 RepID=A0A074ZD95_OPIVI|nr:hypothetical protein T265_10460 [Opisthorchis viverrini]KER21150.1 hypothetical protein T265_10460 [Opisthorchis viverrini]